MREGWEYKRLGEVASFINGYAFKPEQWTSFGTPIVRIQNLNNPNAPFNYFSGEVPDKVKIKNGDLLISWSASLGAYIWRGGYAYLNQHIFKVEFDKLNIDKMYLKYAVISNLNTMAGLVHGATMKHIVKKDFDNTCIPVPSLSTQESIVSELDKINELISLKKEQLKDYDNLAQSIFYDMFGDPVANDKGWEVKKLGEVYKVTSSKRILQQDWQTKGIPFYKVADIVNLINNELVVPAVYIKESTYEELKHKGLVPKGNDILITSRGTIGMCYIVKSSDKFYFQDGMITWLLQKEGCILPQYLKSLFEVKSFLDTMLDKVNISTVAYLSIKQMSNATIPLPPLPLQQAFAKRIEAIEQQKQLISSEIKDLETLLASRMQYWFD